MEAVEIERATDTGEIDDMTEAPLLANNKIYYNCTECSSAIEIVSIDDYNIQFKCDNNHSLKMKIKDYLNKMKTYNNIELNKDRCNTHNEEYESYCFDCKAHLCKQCLKLGEHRNHGKIYIIENIPKEEQLNKIKELIKDNKAKVDDLNKKEIQAKNILDRLLLKNKNKIKNISNKTKEKNVKDENEELRINENNYKLKLEKLRKEYEKKIKLAKRNYNKRINNIKNKYKKINFETDNIYINKIEKLNQKINQKYNSYKFKEKIETVTNFNEVMEIFFNTYLNYKNNYFNSLNINNIYDQYYNNIQTPDIEPKDYNNTDLKKKIEEKDTLLEQQSKIILKNSNLIERKQSEIDQYKKDKNTIKIIYKKEGKEKELRIFGEEFVSKNKSNCKIFFDNKSYDLNSKFNVKKISQLEIELIGILKIDSMEQMFCGCTNLISLPDIHLIDTSNINNMSSMFKDCSSLSSLPDISRWNTVNVNNMNSMFRGCSSLISLPDISNWNTNNVNNLGSMFRECTSLLSIPDISKWNTDNVSVMGCLFYKCSSILSLPDISQWNTNKVTNMNGIFCECSSLLSLPNISKWNTDNVNNMGNLFSECSSLISLPDISKWNTNKLTNMRKMFYKCSSLLSIPDISEWNTVEVNYMEYMFYQCCSLISLPNISKWKANNVTSMDNMFGECLSLTSLPMISNQNSNDLNPEGSCICY